jgi:hypothetical protein
MTWLPIEWARGVTVEENPNIPAWMRISGAVLRALFIACLLVITVRVSMPQSETIWTAYDTPGDLVRLVLGLAVCVWIAMQLFRAPKDAHGHRTFLYFGLAAVPLALLCIYVTW